LFEVVAPIFAVPKGRPGCPWGLWLVRIRPRECNGRGVLMEPRRRDGIDCEGLQRKRAKHLVEVGRKQRIEDVPQPVIMERVVSANLLYGFGQFNLRMCESEAYGLV